MTEVYLTVGCEAYISGRPLVNMANRVALSPGRVLGVVYITVTSNRRVVAARVSASSVATDL